MKKTVACIFLVGTVLTSCGKVESKSVDGEPSNSQVTAIAMAELNVDMEIEEIYYEILDEIDTVDMWSQQLFNIRESKSSMDINHDNIEDKISIIEIEQEGSWSILEFKLFISGMYQEFVIDIYDAAFIKILEFDIDQDSREELLLVFNSRSQGGQGSLDIYVIQDSEANYEVLKLTETLMRPTSRYPDDEAKDMVLEYINNGIDIDETWNVDGIYQIEKILYEGEEKLLAYQDVWNQGHADGKGIIKSIVYLKDNNFEAEMSWFEEYPEE